MASLQQTCSKLEALRDDTFQTLQLCGKRRSSDIDVLQTDLSAFYESVEHLSRLVFSSQYSSRSNIEPITARINGVTTNAHEDIRLLASFLEKSRSPKSSDRDKFKNFGYELYEHDRKFQRLSAQIQSLDGWSDAPVPKMIGSTATPPAGLAPPGKKVSFDSSLSSGSRNAPPSPFQATVEDDIDEDDPDYDPFHAQGQADPPLFDRREDLEAPAGESDMTPPRVVVRSPTDPATLESEMQTLDFEAEPEHERPSKLGSSKDKQPYIPQDDVIDSDDNQYMEASTQSLSNSQQKPRTRSQIEAELRRLNDEIAQLKQASDSGSSSKSRHSPSQSVDATSRPNHFMRPPPVPLRPRANTATSAEARLHFSAEEYRPGFPSAFGQPPRVSPRFSPMTPTSPRSPAEAFRAEDRRGGRFRDQRMPGFAADPQNVLPTVLETGQRPGPRGGAGRDHRASWAAEDFRAFFDHPTFAGIDPPLFPQNDPPSRPAAPPRTTSNKDELPPGVSQKKLPVTLEDIFAGASKKVRFKRRVPDRMGVRMVEESKILTVQIFPGLKPGSRIKHPDEGDYNPTTGRLGEVWFLLVEQDHERFDRHDRDLHTTLEIPLRDALCGWSRTVRSICGKDVKVRHPGVTSTGWKEYYPGLGMPKYDRDHKEQGGPRGDMVVEAKVIMPVRLEDWQKEMIRRALGSGPSR